MMHFSSLLKEKMLLRGDSDHNFVQKHTGPHSQVFRQRLLSHDNVFGRQDDGLHQPYGMRRALPKGFSSTDFYRNPSESLDTKPVLLRDLDSVKFRSLETVGHRLSIPGVELMQSTRKDFLFKHKRPLDLQLPADQYIFHASKNYNESFWHHHSKESAGSSSPCMIELELALGPGLKSKGKNVARESYFNIRTQIEPRIIIDLEEPAEERRNRDAETLVFPDNSISKLVKNCPSSINANEHCTNQDFFSQGIQVQNADGMSGNSPPEKQNFATSRTIDLNETPVEEYLFDLNDPEDDQNEMAPEYTQLSSEKSEVEDPIPFCSDQSQSIQEKHSERSPPSYTSCCITDSDLLCARNANARTESKNPDLDNTESIGVEGRPGIRDGISTSARTASATIKSRNPNLDTDESIDTEGQLEFRESESEDKEFDETRVSLGEPDPLIHNAAISLMKISSSCSENQDCWPRIGACKSEGREEMEDHPECSSDSYELNTLRLTEMSPEEYCVSSMPPTEPLASGNKDYSLKLRRGRRMKDFQRDILPGLASLSRHEIREDINILEGVMRSREYRKMMGERSREPARNRRPGLRQVRRTLR